MNGVIVSNVITHTFIILVLALWASLAVRHFINRFSKTKNVSATVKDKYIVQGHSKIPNIFKGKLYVVVFSTGDETLSLYVSSFSYSGYKIKEKGTLRYRGNRVIDFK